MLDECHKLVDERDLLDLVIICKTLYILKGCLTIIFLTCRFKIRIK